MDSRDRETLGFLKEKVAIVEKGLELERCHCRNLHREWMVENAKVNDREKCVMQLEMEVDGLAYQIYSLIDQSTRLRKRLVDLDNVESRVMFVCLVLFFLGKCAAYCFCNCIGCYENMFVSFTLSVIVFFLYFFLLL